MFPETYSQYDEQQAILRYFRLDRGEQAIGRFLDIGAWDPKTFSNTRALFEAGWSGVVIEPSPDAILGQMKEYGNEPRVQIIQSALALDHTPLAMWMTSDCTSTADAYHHDKYESIAGFKGKVTVIPVTWDDINLWFEGFTFVSIDAEGTSVDLFHAMLRSGQKPTCVCVEHDGTRMMELSAAATAVGYKILYSNGTNAVMGL